MILARAEGGGTLTTRRSLIDVRVLPGCLILTAREPTTPPEPEIMQTLRKVCKLSARNQRQVTDLIEVISRPQSRTGN